MAEEQRGVKGADKEPEGALSPAEVPSVEGKLEIFPLETREAKSEQKEGRGEDRYREILAKTSSGSSAPASATEDVLSDVESISAALDEEGKIQKILDLAETKGVVYAVKVARTLDDYYALDQVHDALADRLYEGLLTRGLIQKD